MYLRYIYKLHDLHLPAENYTEAGFTMKLYADQLSWTARTLVSDPHYPGQQEWQRKEQLYHQIIKYFDSGKVNVKPIDVLREYNIHKLLVFSGAHEMIWWDLVHYQQQMLWLG